MRNDAENGRLPTVSKVRKTQKRDKKFSDPYIATGREPHHRAWQTFFPQQAPPPPDEASPKIKMAYIQVPEGVPGIRSLVMFRPETGKPLYELAQVLLRGESPLSEAERELIAAYVSSRNDTMFCMMSHAAAARHLYGDDKNIVDDVLKNMHHSKVSDKLKALLHLIFQARILFIRK